MTRVLVIDDEPDLRLLARLVLERAGFDVDEADDGDTGLATLDERPADVVLLDLRMPRMDGWAVLDRLRTAGRLDTLAVVVVSADAAGDTAARALELGCRGYLQKPFSPTQIADAMSRLHGELTGS